MPEIRSVNRVAGAALGNKHTVLLFDKVRVAGHARYAFLVIVYSNTTRQPAYMVGSEVNAKREALPTGSHLLVVFDGTGRSDRGASDDWGDAKKFFAEALRIASDAFGAEMPAI